jgi:hypothetical protein
MFAFGIAAHNTCVLEELDEIGSRDAGALVVMQRVEPKARLVDNGLVNGECAPANKM